MKLINNLKKIFETFLKKINKYIFIYYSQDFIIYKIIIILIIINYYYQPHEIMKNQLSNNYP